MLFNYYATKMIFQVCAWHDLFLLIAQSLHSEITIILIDWTKLSQWFAFEPENFKVVNIDSGRNFFIGFDTSRTQESFHIGDRRCWFRGVGTCEPEKYASLRFQ